MRRYKVRRAAGITRDIDLIESCLVQVYQDFGDDLESATERAAVRISKALAYMRTFDHIAALSTRRFNPASAP